MLGGFLVCGGKLEGVVSHVMGVILGLNLGCERGY
jgi:hypothetical protein